jgi:diguanylate cyclase (GGDEF)-like protein/PAS domain S-box-containing protein
VVAEVTVAGWLRSRRLLAASVGATVVSLAWFAVQLAGPVGPRWTNWVVQPVSIALVVVAAAGLVRDTGLDPVVRRFWRTFGVALFLLLVAVVADGCRALADPHAPGQTIGAVPTALYLSAVGLAVLGFARLPVNSHTRTQRLTYGLDGAIVIIAASLGAWYFTVFSLTRLHATNAYLPVLAVVGLGFTGVMALMKVAIAGTSTLGRQVLWALACAVLLGALSGALSPLFSTRPDLTPSQMSIPPTCLGVAWAAYLQRSCAGRDGAPRRPGRLGPFSLVPYLSIGAVDVLLLNTTAAPLTIARTVAAGSVVLTGLVVIRQLVAFHDNGRLLSQVEAQQRRFRSLVQNSSDITTILDTRGYVTYVSPGLTYTLGLPTSAWLDQPLRDHIHPEDRAAVIEPYRRMLTEPNATMRCHARMRHADGTWRWLEVTCTNLMDDPAVRGVVTNGRDMTDARRYQDQLSYQATHDELTGLANRGLFAKQTGQALAGATRPGTVAVALVDLDDFKAINDRLGHTVGDALLIAVAARLRGCVRPGDSVARLGGDEFGVLLHDLRPGESAAVAERIMSALTTPVSAAGYDLLAQASIGLAEGEPGTDAAELLRRADVAMYSAKEHGKSRYAAHHPDLDAGTVEHARLAAQLRQALDRGEFFLTYQPIVTLPGGRITGVEALVRWEHPERGLVSPAEFIPVAERTGLIVPIGAWVLRTACQQAAQWLDEYGVDAPSHMSVNVSARQLLESTFPQQVAQALADAGLPAQQLTIEITETAVFGGGQAVDVVTAIHAMGVRIALDDFGTGHSSLGLLRACPVDVIKADKLFVDGVTGTAEQEAIATSISQIAQALGLRAVAEGVETAAQAERLHRLGYPLAQGFHFSRPLRPAELARRFSPASVADTA